MNELKAAIIDQLDYLKYIVEGVSYGPSFGGLKGVALEAAFGQIELVKCGVNGLAKEESK